MKHVNVALFVPDAGCPHRCSFCNQRTISGEEKNISEKDIDEAVKTCLADGEVTDGQIAFFGGSFTGIEKSLMIRLLSCAYKYVSQGLFAGIRISTRPDYINREVLDILKAYGVTSIELGCQSMDEEVLIANNRGHSSLDIINACKLIKEYDFELGVQMMTGLYMDNDEKCIETAKKLIALKPDTCRIYPTIVLENTYLAELYKSGKYKAQTIEEAVNLCSKLIPLFENENIKIIRLGLHSGGNVEKGYLAGAYHPAFAELCRSRIFRDILLTKLEDLDKGEYVVYVNPRNMSQLIGQKKANIEYARSLGYDIKVKAEPSIKINEITVQR